jgi:Protein of unknwon function (DUF3310)
MSANERQVGGDHYSKRGTTLQHWDMVAMFNLDYFQGNVSKYIFRWRDKGGIEDLKKARHYLDKYIEVEEKKLADEEQINVNGDGPLGASPGCFKPASVETIVASEEKVVKKFIEQLSTNSDPCGHDSPGQDYG